MSGKFRTPVENHVYRYYDNVRAHNKRQFFSSVGKLGVSLTDIINRSGLNRSTFYAHYPDVKGIIDEFSGEIIVMFRLMLLEMDFSIFLTDPEPYLKQMISFLAENQELYRLLGQSDMALIYLDQQKKVLIQQVMDTQNLPVEGYSKMSAEIQIRLLLSGVIDIYRGWIAGEIDCTLFGQLSVFRLLGGIC